MAAARGDLARPRERDDADARAEHDCQEAARHRAAALDSPRGAGELPKMGPGQQRACLAEA